ncbi:MAG: hypothetical protein OXD35_07990 [Thiotrichales bacterium]|nr:hypothetical protein [Thiotrichales bacterium]
MFSRIIRIALPLLILVAGIGGMTALVKSKPEREALGVEERSWPVAVEAIEPGTVTPQLLLFALVDSPRVTHLSAAVTADVDAVDVLEGQRVGVDDRLLALDDREIRLIVAQRDAELAGFEADLEHETLRHRNNLVALKHEEELLALARREVARARDLADRNVGSQASLDQVRREEERQMLAVEQRRLAIREHDARRKQIEAQLARARAQRSQAMLDLERTRVHPPFFGRITEVFVSPGDRVRPGDRLVAMFDSDMLELRAKIPLRHLPVVRAALDGGESLSARALVDGQEVRAELHRLTARVDRGSGGADGLFRVTRGNAWLQLGRTVELVMDLPAVDNAVTAPREALYGTDRVFVLDGERMRSVEVERLGETRTAGRGDARLILRSPDLKPDGRLIVTHQPNAIDGLKVRVAETPPG